MSKPRILIVEDSTTQAMKLQHALEKEGFAVVTAKDGAGGLDMARQTSPDIIITDVMMPVMDGYELCSRIKGDEQLKRIPVVLLTTLSYPEDILRGLKCGADNFITKPYDPAALISRLDYILANRKLRQGVTSDMAIEIAFGGQQYSLTSDRIQILDLLLSSFETAVRKNIELEEANRKLRAATKTITALGDLIPICCECKKIRNDRGYWQQLESYCAEHSIAEFTHGLCPHCAEALYPGLTGEDAGGQKPPA